MKNDQKIILSKILDYAKIAGAQGSETMLKTSSSTSFKSQNKKLEEYKVSSSQIVSVRIIKDQHSGISYSEDLTESSLKYMVDQAIANASYTEKNIYEEINIKNTGNTECIVDEKEESISLQEKIDFSLSLESDLLKKGPEVASSPYNGLHQGNYSKYLLNSQGTYVQHHEKNYVCYSCALLKDKTNSSMYGDVDHARQFKLLNKEKIINNIYKTAKDFLTASPIKTGNYSVIFNTESLADLFATFTEIFSAKAVIENRNPFKNKLNQLVGAETLTITDNPLYRKAMAYSLFDDEGAPRQEVNLIKNGKLTSFLHNTSTAKKLKLPNTYSASRSPKNSLNVDCSNLFIKTGLTPSKELYKGKVLEVISLDGLHSGVNFITGDFSCGASGYLWNNGGKIQTVKGVTVSGNFYEMLKNIELLGSELENNPSKTFFAPLIRFSQLTVAGN